jgi:hypothetical protein
MTFGQMINRKIKSLDRAKKIMVKRGELGVGMLLLGAIYGVGAFKSELTPADLKLKLETPGEEGGDAANGGPKAE